MAALTLPETTLESPGAPSYSTHMSMSEPARASPLAYEPNTSTSRTPEHEQAPSRMPSTSHPGSWSIPLVLHGSLHRPATTHPFPPFPLNTYG